MFSHSKILFLVPLVFVASIPTYFLNLIILVCLLFIHAKHSPTELYVLLSNHDQSINQFILIQALKILQALI